jgi:SAM-dependent methyltransferase
MTATLLPRDLYWATDLNPGALPSLNALALNKPYLHAAFGGLNGGALPRPKGGFDSALCVNVLDHIGDDAAAMRKLASHLAPGGRAVVLAPRGQWAFGSLDKALGRLRRYDKAGLRRLAEGAGLEVEVLRGFNRSGLPAWLLNGKLLRRRRFGFLQVKLLNLLVPLLKLLDPFLPWPSLSLLMVARKKGKG